MDRHPNIMNGVDFGVRTSLVIEFLLLSLFDTSIFAKLEGVIKDKAQAG